MTNKILLCLLCASTIGLSSFNASFGADETIKFSQTARVDKLESGHYELKEGRGLLSTSGHTFIRTPHVDITCQGATVILVSVEPKLTRVLDLHDWRRGQVTVTTGPHAYKLAPGEELSLVDVSEGVDAENLVLSDHVRRRHLKLAKTSNPKFTAVLGQCSIVDLFLKEPLLNAVHRSSDKSDRALYEKLIKTAAAISVAESKDPYNTVSP